MADVQEIDNAPNINYENYSTDLNTQKIAIQEKINNYERKLVDLEIKEGMLNNIITRTNATLENIDPSNFKWVGQTQSNLMKQIENLGLLKDIIIKYEDMIFKYRRILLEINEKDLGNRIKINSLLVEEKKDEDSINTVLSDIQLLLQREPNQDNLDTSTNSGDLILQNIQQELKDNDY